MVPEWIYQQLRLAGFEDWVTEIDAWQHRFFSSGQHGDFLRWQAALDSLPEIAAPIADFNAAAVTVTGTCQDPQQLDTSLRALRPWRKGPYRINNVLIDSEWRSDWKWERIKPELAPLQGRTVLDVGCGNGYHCWRMLAQDPKLVLGIDPSMLFNLQFRALQHYLQDPRIHVLPLGIQHMPADMRWFDTVFSMGVLYHRKSPFEHLQQLRGLLRPGGELCLETLVIDGAAGQVLVPEDRYARMNNVWFIPSVIELTRWLGRCGFSAVRVVDVSLTTTDEQRSTDWMTFESLRECLDATNPQLTIEGYPAPTRAVILATA